MALQIETLTVGPLESNCYVLWDEDSGQALIIDPGAEEEAILQAVGGRRVQAILLTHTHFDHIGAAAAVHEATGAPVMVHPAEAAALRDPLRGAGPWQDLLPPSARPVEAARLLRDGDRLPLAGREVRVLETPGHSPGGISFHLDGVPDGVPGGVVFAGDALFAGSIGRTDLPGGDLETLLRSIRAKLLTLADDTRVLPGHGPATTIGRERARNPFLQPG